MVSLKRLPWLSKVASRGDSGVPAFPINQQYEFWNDWVNRSTSWEVNRDNARRAFYVLEALEHYGRGRSGSRPEILEIGCGSGWMALELAKRGQVTAQDLASDFLRSLAEKHPHIRWVGGDFMRADLPGPFDVVVCMETIAHVPDQLALAERIAALTAPGGLLVLTTQNPYVWNRTTWLEPPRPGQLRNWPSKARLLELVSRKFDVRSLTTCAPSGDRGLPRLFNNRVSGTLGGWLAGEARWIRLRERMGLGCSLVLVATRKSSRSRRRALSGRMIATMRRLVARREE